MTLSLDLSFDNTFFTESGGGIGVITGGGGTGGTETGGTGGNEGPPIIPSAPNSAVNQEVPSVWDVAINGHGYMLDLQPNMQGQFRHESIPTLRQAFITADTLGEIDLNPESLWRFSDRDWSHGAGQVHADFPTSDTAQFSRSKGIDVWDRWQLTLLPDTTLLKASTATNLLTVVAGANLFLADGAVLRRSVDGVTWTTCTGLPSTAITALTTDGVNVYIGYTGSGVWQVDDAFTATQLVTDAVTPTAVGYVNGRLMVAVGTDIFNIVSTSPATLPTALFLHPNPTWTWVGFSDGLTCLYAAGYAGTKSEVYRVTIDASGAVLDPPINATPGIPTGEVLNTISYYLGFIFLGSNLGVRMCSPDSDGNLQIGALIESGGCHCFEGQSRFVWFGWDNYDSVSTGLGRVDLTVVKDNGAPAYATDLMVTTQAQVTDVTTFLGLRVFAVAGEGLYTESSDLVPSGHLDSGLISFDLPDEKIALYLIIKTLGSLVGGVQGQLSVDSGLWQLIGDITTVQTTLKIPELRGTSFEIRLLLSRDTDTTQGPTVQRTTLESLETVNSGLYLYAPVMLAETVKVHDGGERQMDVVAERDFLYGLRESSDRVVYQELSSAFPVTVEDVQWTPAQMTLDKAGFNGTLLCKMKTI